MLNKPTTVAPLLGSIDTKLSEHTLALKYFLGYSSTHFFQAHDFYACQLMPFIIIISIKILLEYNYS